MTEAYDWADNARGCYKDAIDALRMEKVSSGEALPLPDRPEEIAASPIVSGANEANNVTVYNGDCLAVMPAISDMVDSIVTDPPYGWNFMGRDWDKDVAFKHETWAKAYEVLKPGGHLLACGGTRTYHRMVCAIEDAGFEIRDCVLWVYSQGFPKSHDISKAIDKAAGAEREIVGEGKYRAPGSLRSKSRVEVGYRPTELNPNGHTATITAPATDAARQWEGWGTALKPAVEMIVVARKPLSEKSIAANVLKHGTGGLNVDGCRVGTDERLRASTVRDDIRGGAYASGHTANPGDIAEYQQHAEGRWPANLVHDGSPEVLAGFPETASGTGAVKRSSDRTDKRIFGKDSRANGTPMISIGDSGSAARFFYCPKADKDDRLQSKHPTVKPVDLMAWLVRLVTPPGGVVLDPFAGSGTTGMACMREGFRCILIEQDAESYADILRRCAHVRGDDTPLFAQADLLNE